MSEAAIAGTIGIADPADVIVCLGFVYNKSRGYMRVDHVFELNGHVYCDVSVRHPAPTDPPDSTTYQLWRGEKGDEMVIELREVSWHNGMLEETGDGL